MIGNMPECLRCKHYNQDDLNANTCAAFPQGIPIEIMSDIIKHRQPHPGDNGIRFEPIDDAKPGREPPA